MKLEGSKWSVSGMDQSGKIDPPHPTPWEFHTDREFRAHPHWTGQYRQHAKSKRRYHCEIFSNGNKVDEFEVHFVTHDRMIATKNGQLYRFGTRA